MTKYIDWISQQEEKTLWIIFLSITLLFILLPNISFIYRFLKSIYLFKQARIIDFSWRVSPDIFLGKIENKEHFWHSNQHSFVIEGGKIILNWHVIGAYRIDLMPLKKRIKGNTAEIIAQKNNNRFQLIAKTAFKTLIQEIEIPKAYFKTVETMNFSGDNHFTYDSLQLKRQSLVSDLFNGKKLSAPISKIAKSLSNSSQVANWGKLKNHLLKRHINGRSHVGEIKNKELKLNLKKWQPTSRLTLKKVYFFKPTRFNAALNENNNKLINEKHNL